MVTPAHVGVKRTVQSERVSRGTPRTESSNPRRIHQDVSLAGAYPHAMVNG